MSAALLYLFLPKKRFQAHTCASVRDEKLCALHACYPPSAARPTTLEFWLRRQRRPAPDGAIVLRHASIIHRELGKVAECVCLLNN